MNSCSNNIPRKHHFVPQFYLRAWQSTDDNKFWKYARNAVHKVTYRKSSSKSVGFEKDLYSLKPDSAWSVLNYPTDALEKNFFSRIDAAAAIVHQKLVSSGINQLSEKDRFDWALFLSSMLERNPNRINDIKQSFPLEDALQGLTDTVRNSEYLKKMDMSALHHNSILSVMTKYITDDVFVKYLANMRWATVDIPHEKEHLLTGDSPLVINGGQGGNPVYVLSIALSPKRLLIIHSNEDEFDEDFIRTLAVMHNIVIVDQTAQYVISSRCIEDGPFTKYSRVIEERLNINKIGLL